MKNVLFILGMIFFFHSYDLSAQELPLNENGDVEFEYIGETNKSIDIAKAQLLENMRQSYGLKETIEEGEDYFIIKLQSIVRLSHGLGTSLMCPILYMCRLDFKENRFRCTWYNMTFSDTDGTHKIEDINQIITNKRNRRLVKEKMHSEFSEWKEYLNKAFAEKKKDEGW
jgi:hypothetical protein